VKKVKLALIIVISVAIIIFLVLFLPELLNKPPNSPINPTPGDNEKGVSIFPVLSWSSSDPDEDTLLYDLYFGKDRELGLLVSNLAKSNYATKKLEFGTKYNWKIVVKDERGKIKEGPIWTFTTNYLPNVPNYLYPQDGATNVSTKPILIWEASDPDGDELKYDIYFGKNPNFKIPIISNYEKTQFETDNLDFKTTYYWKIVAKDNKGGAREGNIWKFTTIKQNDPPYIPKNSSPSDGVTGQPINIELSWESGDPDNDEVSYSVYFGEVGNLKKIVDDLNESKYTLQNLKYETMYNWKVVAKDGKGGITESPVWQFTTNYLPEIEGNAEPGDGESGVLTNPVLKWEATDKDGDKLTYDVYIGKGKDIKLVASNLSTETYRVEGLENGVEYSWKIVVKDERGGVVEGPVWKFTTNYLPEILNTPFPQNQSTNVSLSTSLSWDSKDLDGDKVIYDIYFGKVNPPTLYKNNYELSRIELEKLDVNTIYYWQVVAKDNRGGIVEGPVWNFTTTRAPKKPFNPLPENNATGVELKVSLNWQANDPDEDILLYDIYFGKNNNLQLIARDLNLNKFEIPEKLKEGTTYYWKIVVKDDKGGFTEGPVWKFTTNYQPNRPFNPNPKDGEENVSVNPILSWQANDPDGDRLLYDLYFGTDNNIELVLENFDNTSFKPGQLKENTTYYWKVVAKNEKGGRRESFFWSFTTENKNSVPSVPSNPSPGDKEDKVSLQPILKWDSFDADGDTIIYDVYFGTEKNPPLILEGSSKNYFNPGKLLAGTSYYWKVVAKDGKGGITESPVWQFTTNYLPEIEGNAEPGDGESGVLTSPVLKWKATDKDGDKLTYDVYIGKGKDIKLVASNLSTETYKVEGLENGVEYSWKVVVKDERGGVVEGPVWKFTTKDSLLHWSYTYGGSNNDIGYSIQKTNDDAYIVAGYTNSDDVDVKENKGVYDVWLIKLDDSSGKIKWQKTFGGSGIDLAYSVEKTNDDGYIVVGYTNSKDGDVKENKGEYDAWIVKVDDLGDIKWQKTFGGSGIDLAKSIRKTKDGGYIVVGLTTSNDKDIEQNNGLSDLWIFKLDENGEIVWQKVLGGSGQDVAESVALVEDGYIIVGSSDSNDGDINENYGKVDSLIVKLDLYGNVVWVKVIGGTEYDSASSVFETKDGGFIVSINTTSKDGYITENKGRNDILLLKFDKDGNVIWKTVIGGLNDDYVYKVKETDEGYVFVGNTNSQDGDFINNKGRYDIFVGLLDNFGNLKVLETYGGSSDDYAFDVNMDGRYIVVGYTKSNDGDVNKNNGNSDIWILKIK
jgi:hypothetical protein